MAPLRKYGLLFVAFRYLHGGILLLKISKMEAKRRWMEAQRLNLPEPFGSGPQAVTRAVEHLGYVQIDTIHVIERSHHHVLFNRIPTYRISDLQFAQSNEKSVFEYWTHALSYVPTRDYRFFMKDMLLRGKSPHLYFSSVQKEDVKKVLRLIRQEGPLSIRDIDDDNLVEKTHLWASRKPSQKVLEFCFFTGDLVITERIGNIKKYELRDRHFLWGQNPEQGESKPKCATEQETLEYLLERAFRSQAIVSLDSICHLAPKRKPHIKALIEKKVIKKEVIPVEIEGAEKVPHWVRVQDIEKSLSAESELVHLLSPFDPLVIQRKRLALFFDYEHHFEAYLPKEKRIFGYFALPVLLGEEIVAAIDLKTDRYAKKLLIQKWSWIGKNKSPEKKRRMEEALERFERFQFGNV